MKIRFHRELLEDSIKTMEDIEPTHAAVVDYLRRHYRLITVNPSRVEVKSCNTNPDNRIGWAQTCMVTHKGYATAFTDSLLAS